VSAALPDALPSPVRLALFTQTFGCETCLQARQVVGDLARRSARVTVEEYNLVLDREQAAEFGIDRAPGIAIVGSRDLGLRYYGTPAGHELRSLADAVALAGGAAGDGGGLAPESLTALAALDRPLDIKVFVTAACALCPQTVGLAYRLAAASPRVTTSVIEATEFPELIQRYRISGVPQTVVDDRIEILGSQAEDAFVRAVLQADAAAPPRGAVGQGSGR
jgi:glutaredoxin-like protein